MEICKRCKNEPTCSVSSESDFCLNYEPRPLTNADRIRSMTDEELADWINLLCPPSTLYDLNDDYELNCKDCWLKWLKKEVDK